MGSIRQAGVNDFYSQQVLASFLFSLPLLRYNNGRKEVVQWIKSLKNPANPYSGREGTEYICAYSSIWIGLCDITIDDLAKKLSMPTEHIRAASRFLVENGYLEYQKAGDRKAGFHLSYKGLNWKYFRREEILRYIADKWVDFFAAVISLLSLVISIIALLQESK